MDTRALAATLAAGLVAAPHAAAATPTLLWSTATTLRSGRIVGGVATPLATLPALDFPHLADGVAVGSITHPGAGGNDRVVAVRARDGHVLRTFRNAFLSAPLPGGRAIVFGDDRFALRDPATETIWIGNLATGRARRLVRFADAQVPGAYRPGIEAGITLSLEPSPTGDRVALGWGNDVDVFRSDVIVVRRADGHVLRLTRSGAASAPTWSPDGRRLAFVVSRGVHLGPGDLGGSLAVAPASGGRPRRLLRATRARFWSEPRWVRRAEIDAIETTVGAGGSTRARLVAIDVRSGRRRALASGVVSFSPLAGTRLRVERLADGTDRLAGPGTAPVALPGTWATASGDRQWP